MAKYFTLSFELTATGKKGTVWALNTVGRSDDRWPLDTGKRVTNWDPELRLVKVIEGKPLDFNGVGGSWHVFNDPLRKLFEALAPNAVQFLPARVRSIIGKLERRPYFVANYLRIEDVLHRKASKVDLSGWKRDSLGQYEGLMVPVLDEKKLGKLVLFRIKGATDRVVVRDDIVAAVREQKLTGCVFTPIRSAT